MVVNIIFMIKYTHITYSCTIMAALVYKPGHRPWALGSDPWPEYGLVPYSYYTLYAVSSCSEAILNELYSDMTLSEVFIPNFISLDWIEA